MRDSSFADSDPWKYSGLSGQQQPGHRFHFLPSQELLYVIQSFPTDDAVLCQDQQDHHQLRISGGSFFSREERLPVSTVCVDDKRRLQRYNIFSLHVLICAGLLVSAGCWQKSEPKAFSEEEAKAQREALLKSFPAAAPDTPEQIQQKEAKVAESLPRVYELLELAKSDPAKTDEAGELSMSLVALLPSHRGARVAWCRTQLASFFAKETPDKNGKTADIFSLGMAIRSAALGARYLKENYKDLSEDEVQLCQEIFFNRARFEGLNEHGEDAATLFNEAIGDLMSVGFNDVERLKAEPRFKGFFANPKTASVLEAAVAKIEASTKSEPPADSTEEKPSP